MVAIKMSLVVVCALIALATALPAPEDQKEVAANVNLEQAAEYMAALFDEPKAFTEDSVIEIIREKRGCKEVEVQTKGGRTIKVRKC